MTDETTQEDEIITEEDLAPVEPTEEELAAQEEANQKAKEEALEAARIAKAKEIEEARVVEEARQQGLKDRYAALIDSKLAAEQLGLCTSDLHFNQFIMTEKNHAKADSLLKELEDMDKACQDNITSVLNLEKRRTEYEKIDKLLLEGLAEKEVGNNTKLQEYLVKRAAIRLKHPKV